MWAMLCFIFLIFLSALDISYCGNTLGSVQSTQYRDHSTGALKLLRATVVDTNGESNSYDSAKQQLAIDLKLSLRDLRLVDPSIPTRTQTAIVARPTAVLFAMESIKMAVTEDKAFVFGHAQQETLEFISALQAQLHGVCSAADGIGFQHRVVETALSVVCSRLHSQLRTLAPAMNAALCELQVQPKGLDVLQAQVRELVMAGPCTLHS